MTSHPAGKTRPLLEFSAHGSQIVARVAEDLQALDNLKVHWQALDGRHCNSMAYFQSFDWCRTFWASAGAQGDAALLVLTVFRDKRLVAVLPLMRTRGKFGLVQLEPLGAPLTQYANLVFDPAGFSVEIGRKVLDAFVAELSADYLTLGSFPESSMLANILGKKGVTTLETRNAAIQNLSSFDTPECLLASMSAKARKNRRFRRNKIEKAGRVETSVHAGGTSRYRELVAEALHLKQDWLVHSGRRTSTISETLTRDFLSALPGEVNSKGGIDGAFAFALELDGKPVAIEISMVHHGHIYSYLGAFDWHHRHLSPGKVEMEAAINWAIETGNKRYDYLGEPAEYKQHWTDEEVPLASRSLPNSAKGWIYCHIWVARLRPALGHVFDRLSPAMRQRILRVVQPRAVEKADMRIGPPMASSTHKAG